MADINLSKLFEKAFGYKSPAFDPKIGKSSQRLEQGKKGSPFYGANSLGHEEYMPVKVIYTESTDTGVGDDTLTISNEWILPNTIVSITGRKKTIEYDLVAADVDILFPVNNGAWNIDIKGFCISKNKEYPEADVSMLINLYEKRLPIKIASVKTDILLVRPNRIDSVFIKEFDLPGMAGVKNVQPYRMTLRSVSPFNLKDLS